MKLRRIIRWIWAIVGRILLYGIALILLLNLWVRFQINQRGNWGNRGWQTDFEPSHRQVPALRADYDDAIRRQIEQYPLETCVVDGRQLGAYGDPVEYDHDGTVIRLCCEDCVRDYQIEPSRYLQQLLAVLPKH